MQFVPWPKTARPSPTIKSSAFARVFFIGEEISFLLFPSEAMPVVRGVPYSVVNQPEAAINCYIEGDDIVCFDGWIRQQRAEKTSHVLFATLDRQ